MNPAAISTPSGTRSARAASAVRERRDETGFDVALGAAAAAQSPRRTDPPREPAARDDARPEDGRAEPEKRMAETRPADGEDTAATRQDSAPREAGTAAPAPRNEVRDAKAAPRPAAGVGDDSKMAMALDAASAAGTGTQNVSGMPPVATQGMASTTSPEGSSPATPAPAPAATASATPTQAPVVPDGLTLPEAIPAPAVPVSSAAKQGVAPKPGESVVAGAGDLAVRVLAVKEAPRPARVAPANATSQADPARAANPVRTADPAPVAATPQPAAEPKASAPVAVVAQAWTRGNVQGTDAPQPLATTVADAVATTAAPAAPGAGERAGVRLAQAAPVAVASQKQPPVSGDGAAPAQDAVPVTRAAASPVPAASAAPASAARAAEASAANSAEPAAEPAPATRAPVAPLAATGTTARGQGTHTGGGQGEGASRRQREAAAAPAAAEGDGTTNVAVNADGSRMARTGAVVATRESAGAGATRALEDPRLEPMRRAADQVTLKFEGEDGLEGRLRISVRGDTVRASILSSNEGTLQRLGSELGTLRRALGEQGFTTTRVAVTDTRAADASGTSDTRQNARDGEERRQGEPQRRPGQGRESRQGGGSNTGHRGSREERRSE